MMNTLEEIEKREFVMNADLTEYFSRDELPTDKYIHLLQAIRDNNEKEYTHLLVNYKITALDMVTGLDEEVEFGSEGKVDGSDLNPLHWAVYTDNMKAVQTIVDNVIFNIIIAGKVPSNSGYANESEISHSKYTLKNNSINIKI